MKTVVTLHVRLAIEVSESEEEVSGNAVLGARALAEDLFGDEAVLNLEILSAWKISKDVSNVHRMPDEMFKEWLKRWEHE